MKTTQHTPGPWKFAVWDYDHASPPRKELNIESSSLLLATLQCDHAGSNPYTVPKEEAEANARLIAAAPELLEALEGVLISSEDGGDMNDIDWSGIRTAIAKATGPTEYDTAKQEASAWRDKAKRGDHPGRGFCLTQAEHWESRAAIAKAKGQS